MNGITFNGAANRTNNFLYLKFNAYDFLLIIIIFQISDQSIARLEASKVWKVENEFYEFAETQFRAVKSALLTSKKNPMLPHFHYDKIRPKF